MPAGAMPGGRVVNAAAMMARDSLPVIMASEAAADPVGDRVVGFLSKAGVDVSSVDRFTEGHTPLSVYTGDDSGNVTVTRYDDYGQDGFDIVWPRVDDDSIVVFGGYYAIDARMRQRMLPFLNHCAGRGALLVYLPGFPSWRERRITRVMPAILENLEMAHMVIADTRDLCNIFGSGDLADCYADHIVFYCRSMLGIDPGGRTITYFSGNETSRADIPGDVCMSLHWYAGAVAGVVASVYRSGITPAGLDASTSDVRGMILSAAVASASRAASDISAGWQRKI